MAAKLIGLVIPLGLDTLAVSAALAVSGISPRRRLRTSLLFAAFEAGMPLVGLAMGRPLAGAIGSAADYLAIAVLLALAIHMLASRENDDRLAGLLERGGLGAVAVAVSVSLDELAIGFTLGLLRLPVIPVLVLIAAQAFAVSQVGMRLGGRIGEGARELAERLAGLALAALAVWLLVMRVAS